MAAADVLWAEVESAYDAGGLTSLTNIRNRAATTIDAAAGVAAASTVIALWPLYAQVEFDETDAAHLQVGTFGVIAVLWRRGGTSTEIEQVKWNEVFGDDGMLAKLRRTGPRARVAPISNSGVIQADELRLGRPVRGWADRESLPPNYLPDRRSYDGSP